MDKALITARIRQIAETVAAESELELVHVEIAGTNRDSVVRIFIDKEGGVGLDDCSAVSQKVESVLDEEDFIPTRYVLEVSSPGIERQLYSLKDFSKYSGQMAKIKTKIEIDGQKVFVGTIAEVDGQTVTLDDKTRGAVTINYDDIAKANLKIDLAKEFGGSSRK
jgi:ribosome maturation factor RimP